MMANTKVRKVLRAYQALVSPAIRVCDHYEATYTKGKEQG